MKFEVDLEVEVGSVWINRYDNVSVCLYTAEKLIAFISYKLDNGVFNRTSGYLITDGKCRSLPRQKVKAGEGEGGDTTLVDGKTRAISPPSGLHGWKVYNAFRTWYYGLDLADRTKFDKDKQDFEDSPTYARITNKPTSKPQSHMELVKFLLEDINKHRLYLLGLENRIKEYGIAEINASRWYLEGLEGILRSDEVEKEMKIKDFSRGFWEREISPTVEVAPPVEKPVYTIPLDALVKYTEEDEEDFKGG
jgi:hypothetical protein